MRTSSYNLFITASISAVLIAPSFAIEAPADHAPPPPAIGQASAADAAPAFKPLRFGTAPESADAPQASPARDTAYLGVVTSEVPDILAGHLKLSDGQGILIRSLMPDGPAAKAGIATNDIITRVGDQAIQTPQDLSNSILQKNPDDVISIHLIHKGDLKTINITLAKRPQQFAAAQSQGQTNLSFDQLPEDLADRIRGALQGNFGSMDLDSQTGALPQPMQQGMQELQQRMQGFLKQAPGNGGIQVQSGTTLRLRDQNGCIEIKSGQNGKEVTLHDPNGEIAWAGPWNSEQDKAAAPLEIRKRIEAMNLKDCPDTKTGFQLQIPQASAPLPGRP